MSDDDEIEAAAALVVAAVAQASAQNSAVLCEAAAVAAVAEASLLDRNVEKKPNGRYLRNGVLPKPENSFWRKIYEKGEEREFFHFISLSRSSFNVLVELCAPHILSAPLKPRNGDYVYGTPRRSDLKHRLFKPHDIIAMAIKCCMATAEAKDIHPCFGALASTFSDLSFRGMQVIVQVLIDDARAKVVWNISSELYLHQCAARSAMFTAVPGVVAMLDGLRITTDNSPDTVLQNADYSGYGHDCFRNNVLLWDTFGKICDCSLNAPGNFHDSKNAFYGRIYRHIRKLPEPYRIVSDDAFYSKGDLEGKIIKSKYEANFEDKTDAAQQTTHLRQPSEWGNNTLTGAFRRLKMDMPTDNVERAYILWTCVLLTNWRTETCDRSQIRTYFDFLYDEAYRHADN